MPPQAAQLEKAEESLSSHSASEAVAKSEQGGKGEEDREKGGGGGSSVFCFGKYLNV